MLIGELALDDPRLSSKTRGLIFSVPRCLVKVIVSRNRLVWPGRQDGSPRRLARSGAACILRPSGESLVRQRNDFGVQSRIVHDPSMLT